MSTGREFVWRVDADVRIGLEFLHQRTDTIREAWEGNASCQAKLRRPTGHSFSRTEKGSGSRPIFREYKVGGRQRFFAWWWNDNLVVFGLGAHTNKFYQGMMYDGTTSIPVKFDNFAYFEKNNETKLIAMQKKIGGLIKELWPFKMNTMNEGSPYGAIYN